jgi:hypothetical protein
MNKFLALLLGLSLSGALVQGADDKKPEGDQKNPAAARRKAAIEKYDKNGDGKLDETEQEARRKDMEDRRKEFISKYDKNGDGKLDEEELKAYREDRKKALEKPAEKAPKKEDKN